MTTPSDALPRSLQQLKSQLTPFCKRHRVAKLEVFGSVARGETRAGSNLDLLVTFSARSPFGMGFLCAPGGDGAHPRLQGRFADSPVGGAGSKPEFAAVLFLSPPKKSMPPRQVAYLLDIFRSLQAIQDYLGGYSRERFLGDAKTQDAVLRRLLVIGEASERLPPETC